MSIRGNKTNAFSSYLYFISFSLFDQLSGEISLGNVNSHFTLSPSAGSNITRLLLASPFRYAGGLDEIWDYRLLIYITDDNLLSGRTKAEALVETGTVTLSVKVTPHLTSIVTPVPRVRVQGPVISSHSLGVYSNGTLDPGVWGICWEGRLISRWKSV